jgi:hypothetical protein
MLHSRARIFALLLIAFASVTALHAQSKPKKSFSLTQVPDQWAQVRGVPDVIALQKCENWAWAADVEAILKKDNVTLDQKYWIDKLNGGSVCQPTVGPPEYLPHVIDGDYTLPDGRKFKLESHYYEGAPTSTDRLLVPLALGRPYILWWKQHAYVVTGALWNEYIFPNGQKQMEMKEISLLDPYVTGEKRKLKFVAGTDSAMDIGGMFEVIVTPVQDESPWKRQQ